MEEVKVQILPYNGDKKSVKDVMKDLLGDNWSKLSELQFLDIEFPKQTKDSPSIRNRTSIYRNYDSEEQWEVNDVYQDGKLPFVKRGTLIAIPTNLSTVEYEVPSQRSSFLKQQGSDVFWSKNYERLISDPEYLSVDALTEKGFVNTQITTPNVRIWIYSSAVRKLIDISKFVINCSTSKSGQQGSFQITLPPLYGEELIEGELNFYGKREFHNVSNPLEESVQGKFKQSPFKSYFNYNDLVFIRFETLILDKEDVEYSTEVPLNQLSEISRSSKVEAIAASKRQREKVNSNKSRVWDMIGLVDNITESYMSQENEASINIQGRDLMKLLSDDGSYFIPEMFVSGSSKRWLYGGSSKDEWFRRNMINGNIPYMSLGYADIKTTLQFFINKLSNIEIVDDSVFQSYKDKRLEPFEVKIQKDGTDSVDGIWRIVKLFVEDRLDARQIVDKSLRNPADSILGLFDKVCQNPFIELMGDTYGNTFDLVVRQPPFTGESIKAVVKSETYIRVETKDLLSFDLSYDQRSYAWYQIKPRNSFFGQSSATALAFTPIIYLEDFVKWRGNKRMILDDIYIATHSLAGDVSDYDLNLMSNALANDLLFVVETNAYLPFTRTGTIVINGDRRIKCGTFIYLEAFDELFYVNNVTHGYNVSESGGDRTTILQVERGMLKHYIEGSGEQVVNENENVEPVTYFNICNTEEIRKNLSLVKNPCEELAIFDKFKVNKLVFETLKNNFEK